MKRDVSRMRWMCFIQPDASSPARNPEIVCVGKHTADGRVESVCVRRVESVCVRRQWVSMIVVNL